MITISKKIYFTVIYFHFNIGFKTQHLEMISDLIER